MKTKQRIFKSEDKVLNTTKRLGRKTKNVYWILQLRGSWVTTANLVFNRVNPYLLGG